MTQPPDFFGTLPRGRIGQAADELFRRHVDQLIALAQPALHQTGPAHERGGRTCNRPTAASLSASGKVATLWSGGATCGDFWSVCPAQAPPAGTRNRAGKRAIEREVHLQHRDDEHRLWRCPEAQLVAREPSPLEGVALGRASRTDHGPARSPWSGGGVEMQLQGCNLAEIASSTQHTNNRHSCPQRNQASFRPTGPQGSGQ